MLDDYMKNNTLPELRAGLNLLGDRAFKVNFSRTHRRCNLSSGAYNGVPEMLHRRLELLRQAATR